jgi:hypothetical protein
VDTLGVLRDSILAVDGPESVIDRDGTSQSRIDAPFQRRPVVLFVQNGDVLVGNSGDSVVRRYNGRGDLISEVTLSLPVIRATERGKRAFIDSTRAGMMEELGRQPFPSDLRAYFVAKFDRMLRELKFPATLPRYVNAELDPSGEHVWVRLPDAGGRSSATWRVFRVRDGLLVRTVRVPHQGAVLDAAVGREALFTIEADGDGVHRVLRYSGSSQR